MMASRYNRWGQSDVLYVGTTFTTSGGDYRDGVPAVSSRHIERLTSAEDTLEVVCKVLSAEVSLSMWREKTAGTPSQ